MSTAIADTARSLVSDPKARRFALLGAAGCLVGALLAELLLAAMPSHGPAAPSQAVCLLIDCSSSMIYGDAGKPLGAKLNEVKAAATAFVDRHGQGDSLIAVVGFGKAPHCAAALTSDADQLRRAIEGLSDSGTTAMDLALQAASSELSEMPEAWRDDKIAKAILLFTDGQPDDAEATLKAADACRVANLRIVAIGTGDADNGFLAQVTGDPKLVFRADTGNFDQGFKQAEKAIYGGSLVEAGGEQSSFLAALARTIGWSMLAACGLSLALVAGQNLYVHRTALTGREGAVAAVGGLAAGAAGGALGQVLYAMATASAPAVGSLATALVPLGRLVGWTVLGMLVGWGLSWFVPNLARQRAALGGAIGGAIGGVAFLTASRMAGAAGALGGAAILGAAIGLMLALVEAAFRQVWLEVHYGGKEIITVSLGANPVKIGSDGRACQVYARGARPLACQYTLKDGHVEYVDFATERAHVVQPDEEQDVGSVKVMVRASRGAVASSAGEGHRSAPGMRAAPPPPPRINRPAAAPPPDAIAPGPKAPARTLSAPPPRKPATPSSQASAPSPPPATLPNSSTKTVRPLPPPPPPHKK